MAVALANRHDVAGLSAAVHKIVADMAGVKSTEVRGDMTVNSGALTTYIFNIYAAWHEPLGSFEQALDVGESVATRLRRRLRIEPVSLEPVLGSETCGGHISAALEYRVEGLQSGTQAIFWIAVCGPDTDKAALVDVVRDVDG